MSRLVSVAGIALAAASLLADHLTGAAEVSIGQTQMLGFLLGLGVLIAGVLLAPAMQNVTGAALRWVTALYLATCTLLLATLGLPTLAAWVLLGYVAAICLLLPLRFGVLTLAGVLSIQVLASVISRVKVALTGLPLTILDIRIAVRNPAGLWDAMSFPHWTRHVTVAIAIVLLLVWVGSGVRAVARITSGVLKRGVSRDGLGRLLATSLFGILALSHLEHLYAGMAVDERTWHPDGVAAMAERVGVLPFLAYSYRIESSATGDIYRSDAGAAPLSRDEVREAVLRYIRFPATEPVPPSRTLPNIAVVLAESTFDPGQVFRLQGQWNDELFVPGPQTAASGSLKVNAVGGGTWITEFETIVGLDSRLFGYSGYYTHASVAPFVERSIASYLHDRGYRTWAFFPNEGNFYNARRAYASYGFQQVRDSRDLGLGGWVEDDPRLIEAVTGTLGVEPEAPLFAYILLLENHAPHDCGFSDATRFRARFADVADVEPNCELHEYLRRLDSTTRAVRSMKQYLQDLEAMTGRPFVLLVFGDHQPHTFTSTGGTQRDYGPMRRIADPRTTFFHFQASAPDRLECCDTALPAAALPTLLSAFVARDADDVYLGENLWLFANCGSDAVRREFGDGMASQQLQPVDARTPACRAAYERALASYRGAGVVRLGSGTPPGR